MLTDLYKECREEYGFTKFAPQPHLEMADFIQASIDPLCVPPYEHPEKQYLLLMEPRGFYKTTIGAEGASIYCVKRNKNIRILLDAHDDSHSVETLDGLKTVVESPAFVQKNGNWKRDDGTEEAAEAWRAGAITVVGRTRKGIREPTITCAGVNKSKVGGHYDLIIADDIADDKNTQSELLRRKTLRRLGGYTPMLNPGGVLLMIGTRWHQQDVYHTILRRDEELIKAGKKPLFKKCIHSIYDDLGRPRFPTEFPPERIEDLRKACTPDEFAKWYLNEPLDEKSRVFASHLFRYFEGQFYRDSKGNPVAEVTAL